MNTSRLQFLYKYKTYVKPTWFPIRSGHTLGRNWVGIPFLQALISCQCSRFFRGSNQAGSPSALSQKASEVMSMPMTMEHCCGALALFQQGITEEAFESFWFGNLTGHVVGFIDACIRVLEEGGASSGSVWF